jgi:beta-galactosidase
MRKIIALILLFLLFSCSHDYKANTLDLNFYQWNFWAEEGASLEALSDPGCGWDEMHRGVGKLVRIPATVGEHFSPDYAGVSWLHARFTLPERWVGRKVFLDFEGANGNVRVYLEGEEVASHALTQSGFSLELTEHIFYTRDNHLVIRLADPRPGMGGITGGLKLRSEVPAE